MNTRNTSLSMKRKSNMGITGQNKNGNNQILSDSNGKGMSCSTPEPNKASTSPCNSDSDAASPVPFLCTQDGSYGDTEVVWNYYTPNADKQAQTRTAQDTPLSRKSKRNKFRSKINKLNDPTSNGPSQLKKKPKDNEKKTQLYLDLLEMNKNMQGFLKQTGVIETNHDRSGSEEDIFISSGDTSPKLDAFSRSGTRCLRRNLLSSKYSKNEPEVALESDDSMNECLIRASQMVEEKVFSKRMSDRDSASLKKLKINNCTDSVSNIQLDTNSVRCKKDTTEDSFDNIVGNLNDSIFERLTQLPILNESPRNCNNVNRISKKDEVNPTTTHTGNSTGWTIKELIALDSVPSPRSTFTRHSSMPESPVPRAPAPSRPSTSGTALSRHSSMPWKPSDGVKLTTSSSGETTPLKCTPEEIKRKRQLAREKLQAKRLFSNNTQSSQSVSDVQTKKFQPKFSNLNSQTNFSSNKNVPVLTINRVENTSNVFDMKSIIEKKRMEALQKLKMKRSQSHAS